MVGDPMTIILFVGVFYLGAVVSRLYHLVRGVWSVETKTGLLSLPVWPRICWWLDLLKDSFLWWR
jgi:hypothetical protein